MVPVSEHGTGPQDDVASDPDERRNLMDTADPAIVSHLRAKLAEYLAEP